MCQTQKSSSDNVKEEISRNFPETSRTILNIFLVCFVSQSLPNFVLLKNYTKPIRIQVLIKVEEVGNVLLGNLFLMCSR